MKRVLFVCLIALIGVIGSGCCVWATDGMSVSAEVFTAIAVFSPVLLTKTLPKDMLKTPCPIVYMSDDNGKLRLYTLPYLDMCRLDYVWGIEVNGVKVHVTDTPGGSLASVRDYVQKTSKAYLQPVGLPSVWQAMFMMLGRDKFKRTVHILNECRVEAEYFAFGEYWCDCKKPTVVYLQDKKIKDRIAEPFRHTKHPECAFNMRLVVK